MTTVDPIYVDQDVQARITATDPDGAAANPTSVRFKIKSPSGTQTIYNTGDSAVTVVEAGKIFACRFDVNLPGKWSVRGEALDGTGAVVGVDQFSFWVNESNQ